MKPTNYLSWIFKAAIPCAIACGVFAYAANWFKQENNMLLYQCFVVLLTLSFCALLLSFYVFVCKVAVSTTNDITQARKKGMSDKSLLWFFISLGIGIIVFLLCLNDSHIVPFSIIIGLLTFLALTFGPMLFIKHKQRTIPNNEIRQRQTDVEPDKMDNTSDDVLPSTENTDSAVHTLSDDAEYIDSDAELNSVSFPEDFPKELNAYAIKILFVELAKEQILDKNFKPIITNKTQLALLVDAVCDIFDITGKWKVFGSFWNISNGKQLLAQAKKNDVCLDYSIFRAFVNAEKNPRVGSIRAFKRWIDIHERDYHS